MKNLAIFCLLLIPFHLFAQIAVKFIEQPVSYIPASKTSLHYSWADLDNDNDLDLLITSNELDKYGNALLNQMFTKIYKNNGSGSFSKTSLITDSVSMGSSSVGDYDNDGDLDIIVSGAAEIYVITGPGITLGFPYTKIYQNNITSFVPIETNIVNLCRSAVEFQDLDNDGDLDVIICGDQKFTSFVYNPLTAVYRNNGNNNFEEIDVDFKNVANGRISCFDYDNNGFSDILVTGLDQNNEVFTAIYKNNGGFGFSEIILPLDSIRVNYNGWLDFNGDGRFDLISGGALFKNHGGDVFTIIDTLVQCSGYGDFNNDGFQDLVNNNKIYFNESGKYFLIDKYSFHDELYSCADINKDYKIDIVGKSFHYINNESKKNTRPSVPENLSAYVREGKAVFKWNRSNDSETNQNNITYSVSIGTYGNIQKFFSSGSDLSTGYRRVMKSGNAGSNDSLVLDGIEGTLFWQVQAVDNNMLASQFSKVDTFNFPAVFNNAYSEGLYLNYRWGDYNMDGKMDYISEHSHLTQNHYVNENIGNLDFNEDTILILPLNTDWCWGDYDNDNDIDLIAIDSNFIVINDETNDFISVAHPFPVQQWGKLLVMKDMDNDGDNDFIISSFTDTRIYFRDPGNVFTSYPLENRACDSVICFDYDNDSDNDIFIRNTNTRFMNSSYRKFEKATLAVVPYGLTFDFDNDGDVDVLDNNILYINDSQNFIIEYTDIRKLTDNYKQIAGDYDNDGDFDIVLAGKFINAAYLGLYINDGQGNFTEDTDYSGIQTFAISSSTSLTGFVDFDNDADLDFIYTYRDPDYGDQHSYFERNNFNRINTPPGIPVNLESSKILHGIKLSWTPPNDNESGTNLSYNIRIGTTPGGMEMMSPVSDITAGNLYIPGTGHVFQPFWRNDTMPVGTYYWSVQAVDHGYQGGQWAEELSFELGNVFVDFEYDTVCLGNPTTFTDLSLSREGSIQSWQWDFGDGGISDEQNPQYYFSQAGEKNVKLTIVTATESFFGTKKVVIKPNPMAQFTFEPVSEGGDIMTFENLTDTNDISVLEWKWDFGDSTEFIGKDPPQHGYLNTGTYTVQLSVTSFNGCSDISSEDVQICHEMLQKPELLAYGPNTWYLVCSNDTAPYYKWYYNGNQVFNATSYIHVVNKMMGEYQVAISSDDECYVSSDRVWIPVTGVSASESKEFIRLYPNPNDGYFGIYTLDENINLYDYKLIDVLGKEIASGKIRSENNNSILFKCDNLNDGIYIIEIYNDHTRIYSDKIVIKKQ